MCAFMSTYRYICICVGLLSIYNYIGSVDGLSLNRYYIIIAVLTRICNKTKEFFASLYSSGSVVIS